MRTPLLLIHFNRPETTRRQLATLARWAPERVWFLCDGPRPGRPEDAENVDAVRAQLCHPPWQCRESRYRFRKENFGVAGNIAEGISWFLEEAGEGIILEDDCLPGEAFFPFCGELLERYRDVPEVMAVSGSTGRVEDLPVETAYTFTNYFACWGWATWRRAWNDYDGSMGAFTNKMEWRAIRRRMCWRIRQRLYWEWILHRVLRGISDSWDYRFTLSIWQQGGLVATPKRNLVENIGFQSDATHTAGLGSRQVSARELTFPLRHPERIETDTFLDRWIEDNIHSKSLPVRLRWLGERLGKRELDE